MVPKQTLTEEQRMTRDKRLAAVPDVYENRSFALSALVYLWPSA